MTKQTEASKQATAAAIAAAQAAAKEQGASVATVNNGFTLTAANGRKAYTFQLNGVVMLDSTEALNTYGTPKAEGKGKTGGNKAVMASALLDKVQAAFPAFAFYGASLQDGELVFSPAIFQTDKDGQVKNAPMRRCFDKALTLNSEGYKQLTAAGIVPVLDKLLAGAGDTESITAYMKACYRNGFKPSLTTSEFDYMLFYLEGAAARYTEGDTSTYEEWRTALESMPTHTVTTTA